jgi:integrase
MKGRGMATTQEMNHPKKGSTIKVEPLKQLKDIKNLKRLLKDTIRDYCIFVVGINTSLRASDLLRITVGQVRHVSVGEHFTVREKKTGKLRQVTMNNSAYQAIRELLATMPNAKDEEPRRGGGSLPRLH